MNDDVVIIGAILHGIKRLQEVRIIIILQDHMGGVLRWKRRKYLPSASAGPCHNPVDMPFLLVMIEPAKNM